MYLRENEAERLYYAIFGRRIPPSVRDHFCALSEKIESRYPGGEIEKYFGCIEKISDLEALEVASRYLKKMPVLSEKIKVMVYLAETCPENYGAFINERPGIVHACILLAASLIRTCYKAAKGMLVLAFKTI